MKRDDGRLFYNTIHSLIMVLTRNGLKQLTDANYGDANINYICRNYEHYDPFRKKIVSGDFIKMEMFFLSFYYLVDAQGFLEVKREDVS